MIYIEEAHPSDGWQVDSNLKEDVVFEQPKTLEERVEVGQTCVLKTAIELPSLVDGIDNTVSDAYAALPERLYYIEKGGKIIYNGAMGPFGFFPDKWREAMIKHLAKLDSAS